MPGFTAHPCIVTLLKLRNLLALLPLSSFTDEETEVQRVKEFAKVTLLVDCEIRSRF